MAATPSADDFPPAQADSPYSVYQPADDDPVDSVYLHPQDHRFLVWDRARPAFDQPLLSYEDAVYRAAASEHHPASVAEFASGRPICRPGVNLDAEQPFLVCSSQASEKQILDQVSNHGVYEEGDESLPWAGRQGGYPGAEYLDIPDTAVSSTGRFPVELDGGRRGDGVGARHGGEGSSTGRSAPCAPPPMVRKADLAFRARQAALAAGGQRGWEGWEEWYLDGHPAKKRRVGRLKGARDKVKRGPRRSKLGAAAADGSQVSPGAPPDDPRSEEVGGSLSTSSGGALRTASSSSSNKAESRAASTPTLTASPSRRTSDLETAASGAQGKPRDIRSPPRLAAQVRVSASRFLAEIDQLQKCSSSDILVTSSQRSGETAIDPGGLFRAATGIRRTMGVDASGTVSESETNPDSDQRGDLMRSSPHRPRRGTTSGSPRHSGESFTPPSDVLSEPSVRLVVEKEASRILPTRPSLVDSPSPKAPEGCPQATSLSEIQGTGIRLDHGKRSRGKTHDGPHDGPHDGSHEGTGPAAFEQLVQAIAIREHEVPQTPGTDQTLSAGDDSPRSPLPALAAVPGAIEAIVTVPTVALPLPPPVHHGPWHPSEVDRLRALATACTSSPDPGESMSAPTPKIDWKRVGETFGGGRTKHQVLIKAVELGLKAPATPAWMRKTKRAIREKRSLADGPSEGQHEARKRIRGLSAFEPTSRGDLPSTGSLGTTLADFVQRVSAGEV